METRKNADGRGAQQPEKLLLTARQAWEFLGIGRTKWWALQAAGEAPLPVDLPGRRMWSRAALIAWVASRQEMGEAAAEAE